MMSLRTLLLRTFIRRLRGTGDSSCGLFLIISLTGSSLAHETESPLETVVNHRRGRAHKALIFRTQSGCSTQLRLLNV